MINLRAVSFKYPGEGFTLSVPHLDVATGERLVIVGVSGSGKTTLLDIMAGIRTPSSGEVTVAEVSVSSLNERARRRNRLGNIGLIFQGLELLEYLSVLDNILLPYRMSSELTLSNNVTDKAVQLAHLTGIGQHLQSIPRQLSQGERQRIAICRALVTSPELILADEPTGNLDPDNKHKVLDVLLEQVGHHHTTLVMVTHDHELLGRFDRVLDMRELA